MTEVLSSLAHFMEFALKRRREPLRAMPPGWKFVIGTYAV